MHNKNLCKAASTRRLLDSSNKQERSRRPWHTGKVHQRTTLLTIVTCCLIAVVLPDAREFHSGIECWSGRAGSPTRSNRRLPKRRQAPKRRNDQRDLILELAEEDEQFGSSFRQRYQQHGILRTGQEGALETDLNLQLPRDEEHQAKAWLLPESQRGHKRRVASNMEPRRREKLDARARQAMAVDSRKQSPLQRLSPLPWDTLQNSTSWTEPAEKTWEELTATATGENVKDLIAAIKGVGALQPNRLQSASFEALAQGQDVLLTSMTGSGKTLGFLVPLLSRYVMNTSSGIAKQRSRQRRARQRAPQKARPKILVVAPSRELASQTHAVVEALLAPFPELHSCLLIGGVNPEYQERRLRSQPAVIVGTPGRISDVAAFQDEALDLNSLRVTVFDEVDRLLALSRQDHIEMLLYTLNLDDTKQRVLVSATAGASSSAAAFAEDNLRNFTYVGPQDGVELPPRVLHLVNGAPDLRKKLFFLKRLFNSMPEPYGTLIFCNNARRASKLALELKQVGIEAASIYANKTSPLRQLAIQKMRQGKLDALIATDVATHGLDIEGIVYVINFQLPGSAASYAHRAGRCGRLGQEGVTISLASGGADNHRLKKFAEELKFSLHPANVDGGVLGILE